jgi:hypothetical protein
MALAEKSRFNLGQLSQYGGSIGPEKRSKGYQDTVETHSFEPGVSAGGVQKIQIGC